MKIIVLVNHHFLAHQCELKNILSNLDKDEKSLNQKCRQFIKNLLP